MIVHDRSPAPEIGNISAPELPDKFTVAHGLRVGRTLRDRVIFGECRPLLGALPGRRVLSRKSGHRNRRLVIPIKVELVGHLFDHRPDDHHIEIAKIHRLVSSEIFVADIAAADDGYLPVGSEGLVVHPPVYAS